MTQTHSGERIDAAYDQMQDEGDDLRGWPFGPLEPFDAFKHLDEPTVSAILEGKRFLGADPWSCTITPMTPQMFDALALGDEIEWGVEADDADGRATMNMVQGFVIALPPNCPDGFVCIENGAGERLLILPDANCLAKITRR